MDFDWTEEQVAYRNSVVEFARRYLNDGVMTGDASMTFPVEAWKRCAEFGLQGLPVPIEYGGQGADPLTIALAMEGLGYGCGDNGLIFSLNAQMWSCEAPLIRFGTEEQKQRYLPGLCDGSLIGVQGMTEPGSGSDAFSLTTTARREGESYVLNGAKTFITNAPVADIFVVFAATDRSKGVFGLSAFLVDRGRAGLGIGAPFHKMGLRTSPMSELTFDECSIPADSILGPLGAGMAIFNHSMSWERGLILASAVGTMQRQLETSLEYARQRHQFGKPIGKNQAVANRLVDMKVRLEASRLLLYNLAWSMGKGRPTVMESAIVKLFLSESWVQSSLDTLTTHGGLGYMSEAEVERGLRDALGSRIYSGTSDIQRNLIARHLGL
ncbi:MAG TPA: acyl-CoA dehydrogenase family protein [Acidimicrobiia bacterium]|jgi:alkylation response protein AidB-like acyl-CoA dehydrogenase|nr:acyl-CoA dehydrogenase family protein [Acidimicrobiia bacterium]